MTDTRPLVLGYLRAHLLMTDTELDDVKERLHAYAARDGYTLGTVFVEHIDTLPAAFVAMVQAIERDEAKAIIVPNALHLAPLGLPPKVAHYLAATTGAQVLMANRSP